MSMRRHWSGKLLDASGVEAAVALDIEENGGEVKGEFSAAFLPDTRDACGGDFQAPQTVGPVTGRLTDEGRLVLTSELNVAGEPIVVTFDARPGDADPHARAAFYGTFAVETGAKTLTLQGGSVVLWSYAAPQQKEAS